MKKLSLIATLLFAALLLQECKKDTYTATASSTFALIAVINDTTWTTDTVTATLTYSAANKGKVFSIIGTGTNQKVAFSFFQPSAGPTTGLPLITYNVNDSTNNVNGTENVAAYYTGKKNSFGVYTFTQQGTVYAGSGSFIISAIDSVKKDITGTFSFTSKTTYYDNMGNIDSTKVNQVQSGGFNNLPYTFVSN
jgi:hypothetical protein